MHDLRIHILEVIRQNEQTVVPFLGTRSQRTLAFLGKKHRSIPQASRVFNKYGTDGFRPCIMTQVYERFHAHKAIDPSAPSDHLQCVFVENWADCTYMTEPRTFDGYGYPIVWEYDWAIEVENEIQEFAMTLRVLLDFNATCRAGIFFSNSPDMDRLTGEFVRSWDPFASRYAFASTLHLQVIFFPESFSTWQDYTSASRSYLWRAESRSFVVM